jgi:hypothetical protein
MSSIHNITPAVMIMQDEMQDDHATVARSTSFSSRSISSSITEKQNSAPTILPDEASYANNNTVKTDHEYQFKCDDPENGVNKQTFMPDIEQNTDMDGGYGWLVILGTFMVQVTSFGTASCW